MGLFFANDGSMATVQKSIPSARDLTFLALLAIVVDVVWAEETTIANLNATSNGHLNSFVATNEKISRRLIEDRLTPPRAADFSLWNNKRLPAGEVYRLTPSPLRLTQELDDNVTDNASPKRTRTPTSTQEPNCCGTKSPGANGFSEEDKSRQKVASEASDLERGAMNGPVPRYHGNNPNDDRYSQGWRTYNYVGHNKDRGYYEQRNNHPYDRYDTVHRPTSNYAVDGDRYGTIQRPSSANYVSDGDRYGSGSSNRPGSYQGLKYGYGHGSGGGSYDRPRPGAGNFGLSTNIGGDGDSDYPFSDGGSPTGSSPSNLQTQKAVALKALAGVALIGAAAALATNPILLPISVISGRRKRSIGLEFDNYTLSQILHAYMQPKPNKITQQVYKIFKSRRKNLNVQIPKRQQFVISPECVARLACHVHRDYLEELEKTKIQLMATQGNNTESNPENTTLQGLENWFDSLIQNNILISNYLSSELKTLIQSAVVVGSDKNTSCNKFSCLNINNTSNKKIT